MLQVSNRLRDTGYDRTLRHPRNQVDRHRRTVWNLAGAPTDLSPQPTDPPRQEPPLEQRPDVDPRG